MWAAYVCIARNQRVYDFREVNVVRILRKVDFSFGVEFVQRHHSDSLLTVSLFIDLGAIVSTNMIYIFYIEFNMLLDCNVPQSN